MSGRRHRFGAVRKLPSGGRMHSAPTTFATRDDADQFLAVTGYLSVAAQLHATRSGGRDHWRMLPS
jgi:hypothetical protein